MTRAASIVTPALLRSWPLPEVGSGKQARGQVLVLGGSRASPGAVLLAGEAALRAGAGKLAVATVGSVSSCLAVATPEAQVLDLTEDDDGAIGLDSVERVVARTRSADVLLAGPGLDDPDKAAALLSRVLPQSRLPLVLDALGTAYLTEDPQALRHLDGRVVVTANPIELARIAHRDTCTSEEMLGLAKEVATTCHVVVLAGGEVKTVAAPDGRTWVVEGGSPGLGVSGSGDVQAGIVAGLLARCADAAQAAVWGAYLHARAGERLAGRVGHVGFLARELPSEVPVTLGELA